MNFIERHSAGSDAWFQHGYSSVQRYVFALDFVHGSRVLDVACGTGYGTYVLAYRAAHAVGVDISFEAITEARTNNSRANVEFRKGTLEELALPADSFSTVVSFETIEHLPDPARFVTELARVLQPGGRLLISAPNVLQYQRGAVPMHNPLHLNEPTFEQLVGWLEPHFYLDEAWEQSPCRTFADLRVRELTQAVARLRQPWFYRTLYSLETSVRHWLGRPLPDLTVEADRHQASALLAESELLPLLPERNMKADTFLIVATKRGDVQHVPPPP